MCRRSIALLLLAAIALPAWAVDAPAVPDRPVAKWSTTQDVLLFEGLATFNSGLAAANPRLMGGVILVTAPLAFAEGSNHLKEDIVGVTGYSVIGVYDIYHYPVVYSRSQVFRENFAAWNLWGGVMLLVAHGDSDSTAAKLAQHMSVVPQRHGGLRMDLHWTF